jgi:hypothetical protein
VTPLSRIFPPKWAALRALGQSRIVSLTILAPFIGYIVLFNQNVVDFLKLSGEAIGGMSPADAMLSTLNRLRQIYIGLASLGIASIVFKGACPSVISQHVDVYSFVESELGVMTSARYTDIRRRLADLGARAHPSLRSLIDDVSSTTLTETRAQLSGAVQLGTEGWLDANSLALRAILTTSYEVQNESRHIARFIVTSFYTTGFAFLGWSSLIVSVRIIKSIFTQ